MVRLTKKQHFTILWAVGTALTLPLNAQNAPSDSTLLRTVVVEQEYNPTIDDASKINIIPRTDDPVVTKSQVEYDKMSYPLLTPGSGEVIAPYTLNTFQPGYYPGFIRLGYGTSGNVDILGNYLFDISKRDKLNIGMVMDGINTRLDIPEYLTGLNRTKWKSRYYQTKGGIDYKHLFNRYTLNLAGNFGVDNFNFMNILRSESYQKESDKQHHTYGDIHVGFNSTGKELPIQFTAETNFLYFDKKYTFSDDSNSEKIVRTKADVFGLIDDTKKVGIDFAMNNLFYNHPNLENYSTIDFNPYYSIRNRDYSIRLGVHVDYATGSGRTLQVAPDIRLEYFVADSYTLYLNATGGRTLNDFRTRQQVNPYINPSIRIEDSYNQLEALFGFKGSPADEVWFNLFGGYKIINKDLLLNPSYTFINTPFYNLASSHRDTNHFLLGGEVSYKYKNYLNLNIKGVYYGWDFNNEVDAIYYLMKPNGEFGLNISSNPIEDLTLELGFNYIQWHSRTGITTISTPDENGNFTEREVETKQQMDAVANLQLGAHYNLFKGLGVYAKVDNLLNKKQQYYYGYPTPGFSILGGVTYKF